MHFSFCVHTFFRCSLVVRFSISPLIRSLCRLLLPTLYYRRQQPDYSVKILIVCIGDLNLYAHICAPFLFVCFGKSFGNVRNVLQTFPSPPPDQMLPHPHRKERIYNSCSGSIGSTPERRSPIVRIPCRPVLVLTHRPREGSGFYFFLLARSARLP